MEKAELSGLIFQHLGLTEKQSHAFILEVLDDISLFDRKQRDYGPQNIAAFGEKGVVVRANDKMARLVNLLWTKLGDGGTIRTLQDGEFIEFTGAPANESIEDSWRDLSIYGVIARLCRKGLWNS